MLLSVNSEITGNKTDLRAITGGSPVDSGVPQGELLSRLVELTLDNTSDNSEALATVRREFVEATNTDALVDASAVIGNFQRMVRIADATGIPLDKPIAVISASMREELGYNDFSSADQTPRIGAMTKWIGAKLQPFIIKSLARRVAQPREDLPG